MLVPDRFHRYCRLLRLAALLVLLGLGLLLSLGIGGLPWWRPDHTLSAGSVALLRLVHVLPGVGYLWALWAVQRALGDLAGDRVFHATLEQAIRHIGYGVLAGALLSVFAVTNLTRMIVGGRGGLAYFDLSGIVLGVVGAALVLLAQVVERARAVQAELDEIP